MLRRCFLSIPTTREFDLAAIHTCTRAPHAYRVYPLYSGKSECDDGSAVNMRKRAREGGGGVGERKSAPHQPALLINGG